MSRKARPRAVGDWLLAAVLLAMIGLVVLGDPAAISRRIAGALGEKEEGVSPATETRAKETALFAAEERAAVAALQPAAVEGTLRSLAAFPSRVTGYLGSEAAASYIRTAFERLGLIQIAVDTFQVTVPMDKGGVLKLVDTGESIPLFSLWPNQVRTSTTPPEGLTGPLIDGGRGELASLNGKVVDGSLVLLGFGCWSSYLDARLLGAQAILFYDDGNVSREQARDKFLSVPADVPRFWLDRQAAERLRERLQRREEVRAAIQGRMDWETVPAYNIYGFLPGSDLSLPGEPARRWQDELLVVSAYYDAISVVPALAPGAENACGITALLHLAEILSVYRPKRPVLFLATAGHFEGLAGVNDFLYRHARKSGYFRARLQAPIDFRLFIGLDLSSQNDQVAAFAQGTFYRGWQSDNYLKNMMAPYARRFDAYVRDFFSEEETGRPRYVDAVAPSKQSWMDFMPVGLALEGEAPVFAGLNGLSLATPDDGRRRVDTPLDLPEEVDAQALTRQIQTLAALLLGATRDPELFGESALELKDQGHSLSGTICWFDRQVHFAVPKAPIPAAVVTYQQPGLNSIAGVRTLMVTQTDSAGHFWFDILRNPNPNRILAYKLDEAGRIAWAPDLGSEGDAAYPITQQYVWWEDEMVEVLFPCRSLTLLDLVDARHLVALDTPTVLGENDAPPQWYGMDYLVGQSEAQGRVALAAAIYARPGTRVKILMGTGLLGIKYLLTGAPDEWLDRPLLPAEATPELLELAKGHGYPIEAGFIRYPLYQSAADMWAIDEVRLKILARYGVRNERLEDLHQQARKALKEAQTALTERRYDRFMAAVRRAAGFEGRAYPEVKATASDTVNGIVFYFVLLIPFSFFVERLFFGCIDIRRQLAATAGILVLVFLLLRLLHPAFKLSTSPYIVFLAFVIIAMGVAVIALIVSKFKTEIQKMKRSATGLHEADVGRLSATAAAISLGISNLRKRKLRTVLTAITLILVSFSALSFTSIRTSIKFYRLPRSDLPPYRGALVRDRSWKGLQEIALDHVRSAFGESARVLPRSWYLSPASANRTHIHFFAPSTGKSSHAFGLVGLTPDEPSATGLDRFLRDGSRWFRPGERQVCILPDDLAALVGIGPEEIGQTSIQVMGVSCKVIGLIDAEALNQQRDLDGEKLTPVDMVSEAANLAREARQGTGAAPIRTFAHLEASNVILMPHEEVMELGGILRSVAIAGFEGDDAEFVRQIEAFVTRVALPIFVGVGETTTVYTSMGIASFSGFGQLIVPILIAALIIFNTMLGAVYERVPEIGIYSSLGLTPLHVGALFMAEASVFATLGAVVGYLLGQTAALGMSTYGMLAGMTLNYSSLSAISSTLIVIFTVFLSTLYPAKKAADLTVPDVTRKWDLGEPEGDDWRFAFPFTVNRAEIAGLCAYLHRIFASYGEGSIGEFLAEDLHFAVTGEGAAARYRLSLDAWLAPYDLGISQKVVMEALPGEDRRIYQIAMEIHRLSGDAASWKRLNRRFLNVLRKRFLVWRTLPPAIKGEYAAAGERLAQAAALEVN